MWERNRGNYKETLEGNCELRTRYKLLFYESLLIVRVGQAAPQGIARPEHTNSAISDRTPLRYYMFRSCRIVPPLSNINFFISLCFYLDTLQCHCLYSGRHYRYVNYVRPEMSVCCCSIAHTLQSRQAYYSCSWFRASSIYINKIQQDATVCRCLFTAKLLYMFRVSIAPIIRSTSNVTAASGTGHSIRATIFCQRGRRPRWQKIVALIL
jgi:hypothetical protein